MIPASRWLAIALLGFTLSGLALPGQSQAVPAEPLPDAGSPPIAGQPAAAIGSVAPAIATAEQLFASQLPSEEIHWLSLPDPQRQILLWRRSSYAAPPRGQVLIIATDGWPARNSRHLQALQYALSEHRWDSAATNPRSAWRPAAGKGSKKTAESAMEATTGSTDPVTAPAASATPSASPGQHDKNGLPDPVDAQQRLAAEAEAVEAALDAAMAVLRQPRASPPVLVGLGEGAELALDWLLQGGAAGALVLINMPSVPDAATLARLDVPILDLRTHTDPAAADRQALRARRAQALGPRYRTMVLPPPVGARTAGEPLLARWLRGWLEQLAEDQPEGFSAAPNPTLSASPYPAAGPDSASSRARSRSGVPTSVQRPR